MKQLLVFVLMCSGLSATAQTQLRAELNASVDSTFLKVEVYVRTTSGAPVALGNTNFAFEVNHQALQLSGVLKSTEGPFDDQQNPASYSNLLLQTSDFVNLTVRRAWDGSGSGVMVTNTPSLVATLRLPIVNSCTTSSFNWISDRAAFDDYAGNSLKPNVQFLPHPPIPLCRKPALPQSSISSILTLCPGDSIWLNASGGPVLEWLQVSDSTVIAQGQGIWVKTPGLYLARAKDCGCTSDPLVFEAVPAIVPAPPQVLQTGSTLFASFSGNYPLQWFLNGSPLPNDTLFSLQASAPGYYKAGLQGPCGWVYSNEISFNVAQLEDELLLDDLKVYPNPFRDQTNAFLTLSTGTKLNLDIIDAQGRVVKTIEQQTWKDKGVYTIPIKIKEMEDAAGTYFLRASFRNQNKIIKLIAK